MMTDEAFCEAMVELFKELRHPDVMKVIRHRTRLIRLLQLLDADITERILELSFTPAAAADKDGN